MNAAKRIRPYVRPASVQAGIEATLLTMLKRIKQAPCGIYTFTGASEPQLSAANARRHLDFLLAEEFIRPHEGKLFCITLRGLCRINEREPRAVLPGRICNASERAPYVPVELIYRGRVAS